MKRRPFFVLLFGLKDHAIVPVNVLHAHPVELTIVPHSGVAHEHDDVPQRLLGKRQQLAFGIVIERSARPSSLNRRNRGTSRMSFHSRALFKMRRSVRSALLPLAADPRSVVPRPHQA